jgi:hypothetical protein
MVVKPCVYDTISTRAGELLLFPIKAILALNIRHFRLFLVTIYFSYKSLTSGRNIEA